jgi:hypothetical protein
MYLWTDYTEKDIEEQIKQWKDVLQWKSEEEIELIKKQINEERDRIGKMITSLQNQKKAWDDLIEMIDSKTF